VSGARSARYRSVTSRLSPRDIQARLRSGATVEEVAAEAGVGGEWVERWAGPILAEQQAALDKAIQLTYQAPRRGPSELPLAEAVARNLATKGVKLGEEERAAGWSAYRHQGNEWVVSFRYVFHRKPVNAQWLANLAEGTVVPTNRMGASLGFAAPAGAGPEGADGTAGDEEAPPAPGRRRGSRSAAERNRDADGQLGLPGVDN